MTEKRDWISILGAVLGLYKKRRFALGYFPHRLNLNGYEIPRMIPGVVVKLRQVALLS